MQLHLCVESEVQELRCESARKFRFKATDPRLKETLWGKKVAKANWAGASYCLAPKCGFIFSPRLFSAFSRFSSRPLPSFLNMIEGGKIEYQEAKASLIQCGKRDS